MSMRGSVYIFPSIFNYKGVCRKYWMSMKSAEKKNECEWMSALNASLKQWENLIRCDLKYQIIDQY